MQLGEVYQEEAPASAPPRRPRRRWLLWLVALSAFAGALYVHGPGVARVPAQTVLIVTNDTGWSALGPPAKVARNTPGLAFWVPIAQHAWPIKLRSQQPAAVAFPARTRDGVRLPVRGLTITYRLNPDRAAQVFTRFGAQTRGWDRVVRAQLVAAWARTISTRDAATLATQAPKALVPAVERRLRPMLAELGFELTAIGTPRWSPDPQTSAALDRLESAKGVVRTAEQEAITAIAAAAQSDAAAQAERAAQWRGLRAILDAQREGARMQGVAAVAQARKDARARLRHAQAERATRIAKAQATRATLNADLKGLAAQIDAARVAGPQLLDEAILTHVLPQLDAPPEGDR